MTTETDEAWANPDGSVLFEHRYRPVRVHRDGAWVPTDTTLHKRADGSVAPRAAAVDVVFSGGGSGPLVRLADGEDNSIALGSPLGALPEPVLDGDTATYPEVLPGVDLQVRADVEGFAQVLVVKDAKAAAHPRLAKLAFRTVGDGLSVRADKAGNLSVVDADGVKAFAGSTPLMWDSDAEPATTEQGIPPSVEADPGAAPDQVTMPATVANGQLTVTPNRSMLTDPDTAFPVFIDPGLTASRSAWAMVDYGTATTSYWNSSEDAQIGTWNSGTNRRRAFFNFNTAGTAMAGKYVVSATLNLYEVWAWSCTARKFDLYSTGTASSSTTWNNQPAWGAVQSSATVAKGWSSSGQGGPSSCPAGEVPMDATAAARTAAANSANMTLGIRASSETDNTFWKRFRNNPTLSVTYTAYPTVGTRSTNPATTCATGSGRPFLNTLTPQLRSQIRDPEGASVRANHEWWTLSGTSAIGSHTTAAAASGSTLSATVPSGHLTNGASYRWRVRGHDGTVHGSWSSWCEFTVDTTAPGTAPTVASTAYPTGADVWAGSAGQAGTFTLGASGVTDVAAYLYGLNTNPPTTVVNAPSLGGSVSVSLTPTADGPQTLY
ncbi:MAG TPA: hypothetical protein VNV66_08560, partial [Pilimelia sp.]|nr:hypothetical protein [Pilimelia sp.]